MPNNSTSLADFLTTTAYFRPLPAETAASMVDLFEVTAHAAGDWIFTEGDAGDGWYLILSGEVTIARDVDQGGPPHTLAHLDAGEGFGEMALLEDAPRMATATCATPVTVARLPRETFHRLLADNHPAAALLLQQMAVALCRRLREVTGILQDIVDDPLPLPPSSSGLDHLLRAVLAQH